jgi:hypothetical protein
MSEFYAHVQQMTKMLNNVDRQLDTAVEYAKSRSFDPALLLQSRLAPDMYPLMQQLQTVCDGAKFLAARLSGKAPPKHPDTEQTFDEIRARLRSVLEYLATFQASDFADAESRVMPLSFMPGKGMLAIDWLLEFNLPNTYFHLGMVYAILRHNGVPLEKMAYLGSLKLRDL